MSSFQSLVPPNRAVVPNRIAGASMENRADVQQRPLLLCEAEPAIKTLAPVAIQPT